MWSNLDNWDKFKSVLVMLGFFVAVIATLMCPFSQAMTLGLVGKLWLAYFGMQILLAVLDGSMAEFVCIMLSLFKR